MLKKKAFPLIQVLSFLFLAFATCFAQAGAPLWTFEPLTATTVAVPANGTANVQYRITNQSSKPHTLVMQPMTAVTQITTGLGICSNPFMLSAKASCILSLDVDGSLLTSPILNGPIVCQQGSVNQCYRPSSANILQITQTSSSMNATISVSGSPLTLTINGLPGQLTVNNLSLDVTASNILSNFTGTALDGNLTETGNTCANLPPGASCALIYAPDSTVVPQTNFTIQGSNTNPVTAAIEIESGSTLSGIVPSSGSVSGGTGFILTGTGLVGATNVTFGGVAATSVNVVNSTTVTGVTPAHILGVVDVVIDTPGGGATLVNGYTYLTTAVGQSAFGGVIACLGGGLNNLIASTADNSSSIKWGGQGILIGPSVQSSMDGAANTVAIVSALGANGGIPYAAKLCEDFEVDSQGNTPCEAGNTCYSDWFLPSGSISTLGYQQDCLYNNRVAIGGFTGDPYWSANESSTDPLNSAVVQVFSNGGLGFTSKISNLPARCVRSFVP